jgi:hypothetical protein
MKLPVQGSHRIDPFEDAVLSKRAFTISEVVIQIYIFNLKPGFLWPGIFGDYKGLNIIPCFVSCGLKLLNTGIKTE